jgi:uncharacterized protein YbjT (DUF2867 family)
MSLPDSASLETVCLLGGSGFVGRHIAHRLVGQGLQVRILTRRPERARDLLVLPTAELIECDVHDPAQLAHQFADVDAVINLVGVLHDGRGNESFAMAHVQLAEKVVQACAGSGVRRLLHMSALNADANGPSAYLRSKGEAQAKVQEGTARNGIACTIFRPSVIFGAGDSFLNRFAELLRLSPIIPLACPDARFQPVFVEDVARCFVDSLLNRDCYGRSLDICGPDIFTLRELVTLTATITQRKRVIVGLGPALSRLQASVLEFMPGKPLTRDNLLSMQVDSVCGCDFPLPFRPASLETVAPEYLAGDTPRRRYDYFRHGAGR